MEHLRLKKIETSYYQELSNILLTHVRDPRLSLVRVTRVKLSPDLSQAKVFFDLNDKSKANDALKGFRKCKGFLKKHLGSSIPLRYTPDLDFRLDDFIGDKNNLDEIFEKIKKEHNE
ncbi:MAG: ribosome-binding factor A [Deltaproteobacteria bacterium RIFCSPLOWO2_12_FULL_40_28]|nr:MAG: ribosome-binding factor A [Deltaproteobacteria bacterium RIFCSPHIGHO2_02_FULL_40_28]OGQ20353.1 MAG: ribosome-binding factor A [Deltaproteobacteria bacterium RIFCSPHIGHO2_12_FULL_40_32]OGQ41322.1 MAG: ribosome-binding factor A [Deltaproteobacteria bacterium RIFCSPLOWO2_02_FULL_40_36]OGQ54961.1 MAG: ribosome-binding factor A [Deltaproteobacteria bacterium RIFCSPLOWO2_12_FULL_40_28]